MSVVRPVLIAVTLACTTVALRFAAWPMSPGRLDPVAGVTWRNTSPSPEAPVRADSLGRLVSARDMFRASRQPAPVPFNARTADANAPAPPVVALPPLRLAGVLAGADTAALVDGIPGSDVMRVVRTGDRIGDFTVRLIAADRMVMAGRDTSWTIRLRTP
jgi:hypothetical protein